MGQISTLRVRAFDHDSGLQAERKEHQERNLRGLPIDVARMSLEPSLPERVAVVGRHDDDRVLEVAQSSNGTQQHVDHAVGPADRVVVDVRVGDPKSADSSS